MVNILVLGAGSIGKRHLRNFRSLGCKVSVVDPREDRLDEAGKEGLFEECYDSFSSAMTDLHLYDGVVIGTPPHIHAEQIFIISHLSKIPIFSEKPLTTTFVDAVKLKEIIEKNGNPFMLGYCWRVSTPIKMLWQMVQDGKIGKILHAEFNMGAYLPDWHPWEDYREFFVAKREWGGGALYENHWLDIMLWWFGMPNRIVADVGKLSDLELTPNTDDNVDVIFRYPDKIVTLHLDLYSRPHNKSIKLIGDKGTLKWGFENNVILFSHEEIDKWTDTVFTPFEFERNDMFLEEAKGFLDMIENGTPPQCTINDGINVLLLIEAIRQSSERGIAIAKQ